MKRLRMQTVNQTSLNLGPPTMSDLTKLWTRYREALLTASLFLLALGWYSFDWFYGLEVHGGFSTIGAERVLAGQIPYRDFWTMYAPGSFYLLALLFRIFGTHLLVEIVAASVICSAAAAVSYRLIVNVADQRLPALACAGIFLAATYNTTYYRSLGPYPPAILFILTALDLMVLYYKSGRSLHLVAAGLATGAVVAFKHDVGGYTAIAVTGGLVVHHFLATDISAGQIRGLLWKLARYSAGILAIVVPLLIYFGVLAGPDMWQDLIVYPLTDFPFARPEGYPSLLPVGIYDKWRMKMLFNFFNYLQFTMPFVLLLLGVAAIRFALRRRNLTLVAAGVTFSVGYLLHYASAHVQINTNIITMSVYAACLGVILYDVLKREYLRRQVLINVLTVVFAGAWFVAFAGEPALKTWNARKWANVELKLPKASGIMVSEEQARTLTALSDFMNAHLPTSQKLYVGLHRHDVTVMGDGLIYFLLDRLNATRHDQLHPGIADTASTQHEIIRDLQAKNVSLIILKRIFPDEWLNQVREDRQKNLPHIGATDLDEFIRENYVEVREFHRYAVWRRKGLDLRAELGRLGVKD